MNDEEETINRCLSILDDSFYIERECWGTHFTGKRLRIDAIIKPKDVSDWRNKNVALGIEFKRDIGKRESRNFYLKSVAQSVDYANTKWDKYEYLFIFSYPELARRIAQNQDELLGIRKIMGHLGVGELRYDDPRYYGLTFYIHDNHRIWSQVKGVQEGKRQKFERKFGSR